MKAATFLATLEKLGVQSSFFRPRVSNDNPYSEALFKTLKYIDPVSLSWVYKFVKWYNYIHLHSGISFITPYQRHYGLDQDIINNRIKVYEKAKAKHSSRWSKNTRKWKLPEYVALHPIKDEEALEA